MIFIVEFLVLHFSGRKYYHLTLDTHHLFYAQMRETALVCDILKFLNKALRCRKLFTQL